MARGMGSERECANASANRPVRNTSQNALVPFGVNMLVSVMPRIT